MKDQCLRSVGSMRDEAVERGAFIKIFWYAHRRRLRLGLTTDTHPFSFLWNRTDELMSGVFGARASENLPEPIDTSLELEPMGLDFAKRIKAEELSTTTSTLQYFKFRKFYLDFARSSPLQFGNQFALYNSDNSKEI